jgi:hypothetical protein
LLGSDFSSKDSSSLSSSLSSSNLADEELKSRLMESSSSSEDNSFSVLGAAAGATFSRLRGRILRSASSGAVVFLEAGAASPPDTAC